MLELSPRFKILRDQRLPALDTSAARAYAAIDVDQLPGQGAAKPAVAYLYQPGNSLPLEQIRGFERFEASGMVKVLEFGIAVRASGDPGRDFAVIVESAGEPVARNLVELFDPLSDEQITSRFVRPLLPALREIESRRISHRAIRPNNLYWADAARTSILLGPPLLSPPAQDQPSYLETLDSAMTDPRARGVGNISDDMFSLGVTLLMLAIGRNPLKNEKEGTITIKRLDVSSYEALASGFRLSTTMVEIVRGLLVDSARERWGLRELVQWATDGRRPNPPRTTPPKVAARALKIGDDEAMTARSLAFAVARNWDLAGKLITSEEFQVWIRRSLGEDAVVDRITKVTRGSQETMVRERADKLIMAALVALDPSGPLRYRGISAQLDGLPNLMASALADAEREADAVDNISQMISAALWIGWAQAQGNLTNEAARVRSLLERQRSVATTREPGQGIERCLYELNPGVPCLSPLVIDSCVVDLTDLMAALDRLPREAFTEDFLTDRHILAFLTARSSKITDTLLRQAVGRRSPLQRLVNQVRMLALVQSSVKQIVPNLTQNLADLLRKTAEAEIRGSQLKEMVVKDLDAAAPSGKVDALLKTLEESGALEADRKGFEGARHEFVESRKKLTDLKDQLTKATRRAEGLGPQIAGLIGLASGLVAIAVMAIMGIGF